MSDPKAPQTNTANGGDQSQGASTPPAKLTGPALLKAAAKFTGVAEDDIFEASDKAEGRFAVVTVDGRKFTQTPQERAEADKAAARALKERQAAREARAARRAGK